MERLVKPVPQKIPALDIGGARQLLYLIGDPISSVRSPAAGRAWLSTLDEEEAIRIALESSFRFCLASTATQLQTRLSSDRTRCNTLSRLRLCGRGGRSRYGRIRRPRSRSQRRLERWNTQRRGADHALERRPLRGHCRQI
ncbi:MAG: hypothetical protein EOQ85_17270 [Mesorhizobium sp.]|nr:MAG: hypothetical protein EOQ85_17270 [Mesorhizobium sp.]